jgi:hypothetical protein
MTDRARLITSQGGNTLLAALRDAIPAAPAPAAPGLADAAKTLAEISIATGFVSPAGFDSIADRLNQAASVRLLLGAEPAPEAWRRTRRPGEPPPAAFERREVAEALKLLDAGLRRVRDAQPFTAAARAQLRSMAAMLRAGKLETRRYEHGFLHAKAVLLDGFDPGLILGSSNLTTTGLGAGLELNLGAWDGAVFAQARAWFDALWDAAVPFDLAAVFAEPEQEFPPWLIFLRILFQIYGEEVAQEEAETGGVKLLEFQRDGLWRARRILREFGGVIVADEVGLGKTFIGGAMLEECANGRRRALLVCPAALRDTTWKRFLDDHNIGRYVDLVSFDQLALDRRLADASRPQAAEIRLRFDPEEYALVVVDEAHNYRNPDAPYRAGVLRRLLFGQRKQVVLLTATPVNNSLFDLYHLMRFFLRQDSALAGRGIVRIHERFREAARQDPAALSPDFLYPIIDAVTVKRTRAFVKQYYAGDLIQGPDGVRRPIRFPQAVPITVRYDLDRLAPGLFDAVADALDPVNGANLLGFARYATGTFLRVHEEADLEAAETASGLLRSGLLKRFESSTHAFRLSLDRMVREHDAFLEALGRGKVIAAAFLREVSADEEAFDDLLESSPHVAEADAYDVPRLRAAVQGDRAILAGLAARLGALRDAEDPKLDAVVEALARIAAEARADAATAEAERRNRKVLVFSTFADTVAWLRRALEQRIAADPRLAGYRHRIVGVAGGGLPGEEASRNRAVWGFAPETSDPPAGTEDSYDLLIATDVLAEGLNLQQARHIVNYDLPWNPMRLVQRHGRIDRIGSLHPRVFLRTVFPADRLDALLTLETRILRKLTQAAKSIGVGSSPVDGGESGAQVFAETRAEIERLAREDPTLFNRGGSAAAAQTGEEYRHRLRAALAADRAAITSVPGGAGSGLRRGRRSGVLFCAELPLAEGSRTFLRFVPARPGWQPQAGTSEVLRELGTCLRLLDCTERTPRVVPAALRDAVFGFWQVALDDIVAECAALSDPATLQPRVRPLNRQVAAFLRAQPPRALSLERLGLALDVLESEWSRREEALLREQFRDRSGSPAAHRLRLVEWVLGTGLEPARPPAPLPPIRAEEVRLVCWMAIAAEDEAG